jgi:dipeptidyl aminopeptidase/acylaminoacyl peptidase
MIVILRFTLTLRSMKRSLLFLLVPVLAAAQAPKRAFAPNDWYRVTQVSGPQLSPDGSKVAFTVTTIPNDENRRHTEVWMASVDGSGDPVRLTSPGSDASNPRWSDDGKYLFFTSNRAGSAGGSQWILRMDVPFGEAFQSTAIRPPSAAPANPLRPADNSFTITTDAPQQQGNAFGGRGGGRGGNAGTPDGGPRPTDPNDPYGKMGPMARPPQNSITKPENADRFDGMHITDAGYKANGRGFVPSTGRAGGRGAGVQQAGSAASRVVSQIYLQRGTAERKKITATAYSHRAVNVSPNGQYLVFSADPALRPDSIAARDSMLNRPVDIRDKARTTLPADRNETDLFFIPVAGCEAGSGCTPKKVDFFGTETNAMWLPDSKQLLFVGRAGRDKAAKLYAVSPDGGKPTEVLPGYQFEPGQITQLNDGSLVMQTQMGGSSGIYRLDVAGRKLTPIVSGRRVINGAVWDQRQENVVYTSTDVTHPTEVFVTNIKTGKETKLTSFNDKLNSEIAWSEAERFTFKSVGGLEIESWLMKPYGYEPGKKYPVVLYIHGGPHSQYNEGWFDEFQSLAGAGVAVLYTNPRGSSGYNAEFQLTRGRWFAEDYQDLMKAVDVVAQRADIDSTRMGVTGGSYGGVMTAWVTSHTNRFKAAQTDRMISEWTYWWGASDAQGLTENEFYGAPWQNQAMYDSLSPIRYVQNVRTPTLLVQSEEDHRTPMGDAELWFQALKKLNVPAEFVRYPRSNHDLSRTGEPWLLVDRLGRIRQWFTYWLITNPASAPSPTK